MEFGSEACSAFPADSAMKNNQNHDFLCRCGGISCPWKIRRHVRGTHSRALPMFICRKSYFKVNGICIQCISRNVLRTRVCSVRYRYSRYRYGCRPNVPKCPVPVSILYRNYGSGIKVCTGTGGTGIDVVQKLTKCPVPFWMSYRSYRSVRYRY